MGRPRIGITSSLVEKDGETRQVLDSRYVEAVERAGGAPFVVPMAVGEETHAALLEVLDGLVITGGPGIVEGLVGVLPEDLPPVQERRHRADALAFAGARQLGRPVLGICYGMQFINARLGGTIYADVQAQLGAEPHSPGRNGGRAVEHALDLAEGSLLRELAGSGRAPANSFHIQAVKEVGRGLRVSARSADGLVEGIESEDGLLVGVQFHPERMPDAVWERLFAHLVERARR